jgi:hypothetical protein
MSKVESADLILKLYDLRREATMRKARDWFFSFNPQSAQDVMNTMMDPEVGGLMRMVISYWDMAAAMVNHGAIDLDLFTETNGEYMMVYAKIEPFIAELREMWQEPKAFSNIEKLINAQENGPEKFKRTQEWLKSMHSQASEASA